jgi:hypothetical protein
MSWGVPGCGGKSICSPHASGMCGSQRRSPERSPRAGRPPLAAPTNTPAPPSNFLSCDLPQKSQLIEAQQSQSQRRSQCRREKHTNLRSKPRRALESTKLISPPSAAASRCQSGRQAAPPPRARSRFDPPSLLPLSLLECPPCSPLIPIHTS